MEKAIRWEKTRAKGKFRFVIFRGSVWAGITIFVAKVCHLFPTRELENKYLIISLPVFCVSGFLIYLHEWNRREALYRKFKTLTDMRKNAKN